MRHALVGLAVVVGCAHTVPQDSATGRDGKIKGAVPIKLDNNEGVARGIVTYPGGDRVDWRSIELPVDGTLELKMTYTTPRPGLRVAFDVFDQYNTPIAIQRAVAKRSREAKIEHAHGRYFVRVYAPRRGDAGTYKLAAAFTPGVGDLPPDPSRDVPEPPKLPAVPATVEDCLAFDAHNPSCATACPDDAPTNWKGCPKELCRTPDITNPACQKTMACPDAQPDRRIAACMVDPTKHFRPCDHSSPDPANPRCDVFDPVSTRIISVAEDNDEVTITIAAGSNQHVAKGWTVTILAGNSDKPLPGGTATISHVEKTKATARLHLRREVVEANQNLRLTPP